MHAFTNRIALTQMNILSGGNITHDRAINLEIGSLLCFYVVLSFEVAHLQSATTFIFISVIEAVRLLVSMTHLSVAMTTEMRHSE